LYLLKRQAKPGSFTCTDYVLPLDPQSGMPSSWERLKANFPRATAFSDYADVVGSITGDLLCLSWKTNVGAEGGCNLSRSLAGKPSELVAGRLHWGAYKDAVARFEPRRYLFQGQSKPWRLRTAFHRTGRADLTRFLEYDIPVLVRHLSARTKHVFNLSIPDEMGALFSLVQHHGYPTPLLDWTYSPYVAAFFAYRGISNRDTAGARPEQIVRIHIFDQEKWRADYNQLLQVVSAGLNLSIGEFMPIENTRMIPQQAVSTVTNVDDMETYILSKESAEKKYLSAIDLPLCDRRLVVRELGVMGITAASMLPGLDGDCEELKERNFEV
jgi:hypothetical protein